eukprot:scaffold581_cov263-Pinguiococcus_pyrenoidosus.AAC.9
MKREAASRRRFVIFHVRFAARRVSGKKRSGATLQLGPFKRGMRAARTIWRRILRCRCLGKWAPLAPKCGVQDGCVCVSSES